MSSCASANERDHGLAGKAQVGRAFAAASRAVVRATYQTALENGGTCEGPPGLRPQYHDNYYGAYFRDLDGNKLCVACHAPTTDGA